MLHHWPGLVLFFAGLLFFGLWFKNVTAARAFHSIEAKKFEAARLQARLIGPTARRPPPAAWMPMTLESGVFGRIEIPRLGISALIAEGTEPAHLERVVNHIVTSAFPGQPGNCALAGDREGFPRGLGALREHDVILIDTLQDTYTYEVEWGAVVGPDRGDVSDTTGAASLTLVTSDLLHPAGPDAERFVIRAKLVEPAAWVAP